MAHQTPPRSTLHEVWAWLGGLIFASVFATFFFALGAPKSGVAQIIGKIGIAIIAADIIVYFLLRRKGQKRDASSAR